MSSSSLHIIDFTTYLCRRPTKKPVAAPAANSEQISDAELISWPPSPQLKKKDSAHLDSPIDVSSDEAGSDHFSDTPRASGRPSGTNTKKSGYLLALWLYLYWLIILVSVEHFKVRVPPLEWRIQ